MDLGGAVFPAQGSVGCLVKPGAIGYRAPEVTLGMLLR